ncbi:MAG: VOC family protein [Hamadaea sp.]|uniref:VOC family protein n=1 Tax=Hamadaea sp. TaxID=2024425 RepID=UPI0017B319A9|nr:VOC family protein [Hamadaea sp.]NUR70009.1 VOC family protein [Hamadaea sp.]NUT19717.1 VOC family protein [Hamadaea sp.]
MTGRVVHFEVPAEDMQRAQKFYTQAFGWDLTPIPAMGYTLVSTTPSGDRGPLTPGAINGGLLDRKAPFDGPVITIEVADIDAALASVVRLGGEAVIGRQAVGDMGFTGYFRDTEGNLIGLWQNA